MYVVFPFIDWTDVNLFGIDVQIVSSLLKLNETLSDMQLHIKQVSTDVNDVKMGVKRVESLEERSRLYSGKITSGSNTDHGTDIYNSLIANKMVRDAEIGEGPPAIPVDIVESAAAMFQHNPKTHESKLVSLYTPYLMEIVRTVSPDLRLVNSEYYRWIEVKSGHTQSNLKPDLFSAYHPLIKFLQPYQNAPNCTVERLFGTFASWESRESIHCIWDAKWKIDMRGFGEKCKYLQISGEGKMNHSDQPITLKGVLFDVENFWMIKSSSRSITEVIKCKWSQNGSKEHLLKFLESFDLWMQATNALCGMLHETVMDFTFDWKSSPAWLGSGANGRVFRLEGGKVIKVVVGKKSEQVHHEFNAMVRCLQDAKTKECVFPIVENSYRRGKIEGFDFAGYMLECVGVKIGLLTSEIKCALARNLFELHSNGYIHGDPRIQNALLLQDKVKWIDFRHCKLVTTTIALEKDVKIFCKSLVGTTDNFENQISMYADSPSFENLLACINIPNGISSVQLSNGGIKATAGSTEASVAASVFDQEASSPGSMSDIGNATVTVAVDNEIEC